MKKLSLLIALLTLMSVVMFAQAPAGSISGTITNGGDQKIIDAATVSLFKYSDSSLVKISLADKEGYFVFENILPGKYYLLATSTGYTKTKSPVIEVFNSSPVSAGIL